MTKNKKIKKGYRNFKKKLRGSVNYRDKEGFLKDVKEKRKKKRYK